MSCENAAWTWAIEGVRSGRRNSQRHSFPPCCAIRRDAKRGPVGVSVDGLARSRARENGAATTLADQFPAADPPIDRLAQSTPAFAF